MPHTRLQHTRLKASRGNRRGLAWLTSIAMLLGSVPVSAQTLPLIDAHSQLPDGQTADKVIPLMDRAGIAHVILSFRGDAQGRDLMRLEREYPDRITPAIKLKSQAWLRGGAEFRSLVDRQLATGRFGALGEALVYHAAKGNRAPEFSAEPDSPQFQYVIQVARQKGWPAITHIEARKAGGPLLQRMQGVMAQNPDVPFAFIHMGQLDPDAVGQLIRSHPNAYFMTSHANPIVTSRSSQPWTNMFSGSSLRPEWRNLMVSYPDRFVLALDNVWPEHWGDLYVRQAELWRRALLELPRTAAQKIAYQNAERLWRLRRR